MPTTESRATTTTTSLALVILLVALDPDGHRVRVFRPAPEPISSEPGTAESRA